MYELPLFIAKIEVQEYVAITDETFSVDISVDYAFGKTMHGVANVQFLRFGQLIIFEKTLRIGSESGTFVVNIANELGIRNEERVEIILEFTDNMSDKKINASAHTNIKNLSTVLKLRASQSFKRGQIFKFDIDAIRYDGSPVRNFPTDFGKNTMFCDFSGPRRNDSNG